MKSLLVSSFVIILIFSILPYSSVQAKSRDKIKLKDIQVLTFSDGQMTTGRRSSPIKQLRCVGGYCRRAQVTSAQCYNRGFDGRDVQWECKASMPAEYKFGRMEVACEGYDYPEDDYVLVGSCGLEYTIEETNGPAPGKYYESRNTNEHLDDVGGHSIWIFVVFGVVFFLIYYCGRSNQRHANAHPYGSDSGDFPGASAPPPPGFRDDYFNDSCKSNQRTQNSSSSQQSSSGPGFFSGMTAGGILGYMFGAGSGSSTRYRPSSSSYSSSYSSRRSSPPRPSFSSASSSGFASTSRR